MTVRFVRGKSLKKIKGVQLDKEKLGNKMLCPECGTKFYDLNKPEIICPSCGFNISELIMKETESSKIEDKNIPEVSESEKTDNDEDKLKGAIRVSWCHLTEETLPIEDIFSRIKNIM